MSAQLGSDAPFEGTALGFVWRQFTRPKLLPPGISLTGQVAIVTGSNVGLGFSASRQLLSLGLSHLVMGVRSQTKGDAAAQTLRNEFPTSAIDVWLLDMESYDSVRAFADMCATLPRIDIAILNAGLIRPQYTLSSSTGNEVTLQVNYLSTVLLAILLLPLQKAKKAAGATRQPVLSISGSDLSYYASLEPNSAILPQFHKPDAFVTFPWYRRTKLLQILFISKLAEFVSPEDVLVQVVNPGMTGQTAFFREDTFLGAIRTRLEQALMSRSVDVGATTYLDATLVKDRESHGSFICDWAIKPYPKICYTPEGEEMRSRLWEETMEELNFAGASQIIQGLKS